MHHVGGIMESLNAFCSFLCALLFAAAMFLSKDESEVYTMLLGVRQANSSTTTTTEEAECDGDNAQNKPWRVQGNATQIHENLRLTKINLPSLLQGCRPTTTLQLEPPRCFTADRPSSHDRFGTRWTLRTFDEYGAPKSQGGDEFYVTYQASADDAVTAVAIMNDFDDGSYSLDFVASPMNVRGDTASNGTGTFTIYYDYTCGIGTIAPPIKENWESGGGTKVVLQIHDAPCPHIAPYKFPSAHINLEQYKVVGVVGDSLMAQFALEGKHTLKDEGSPSNNLVYHKCPDILIPETMHVYLECANETATRIRKQTNYNATDQKALLVGHFVWEILADDAEKVGDNFDTHIEACRSYIKHLREMFPDFDLYWKSGSALQLHVVEGEGWFKVRRVYYLSSSRAQQLYNLQVELMRELQVPVLDVYEMTYLSADWLKKGDGRHYQRPFTQFLVDHFYPSSWTNRK